MGDSLIKNESGSSRRNWLKTLGLMSAASLAPSLVLAAAENKNKKSVIDNQAIRLIVSTYSYWHFEPEKYPIEKVIENAARIGFDGVEILHRQMENETVSYLSLIHI